MFLARRLLTASSSHLRSSSSFTPLKHTSLRCLSAMAGACFGGATKKKHVAFGAHADRVPPPRHASARVAVAPFSCSCWEAAMARGGGVRKKRGLRGAASAALHPPREGKAGDSPTTLPPPPATKIKVANPVVDLDGDEMTR